MIEINGVNKSFGKNQVLKDISLHVNKGEIFGIIGQSGAGKSTLLRCLNGLENYDNGSVMINDKEIKDMGSKEIREFRKKLGMIFQNFNLLNRKTVYENVALPMEVWGYNKKEIDRKVFKLLEIVGLEDKAKSKPRNLSGGQKQRVAIARALSLDPEVLLCDEATSALDPKITKSILQLLKQINDKLNITIVIVTHQMEVIKEICQRVAIMENGQIKDVGNVEELFLKPNSNLKNLLGEDKILPETGVNIRIFFPKEISKRSIITSMARELDIDISIVWGKLEKFRNDVLGSLVINFEEEYKDKICEFLSSKNIKWEVEQNGFN
ncbi:methionine ABC transporter ATP-binding protein [Clostridium fermenticellae]|uniref:Methionine ABC transporter ATP-binding protein n=1 Tax=Clostridium fermenticellae TaxID=2068654 RepID=A0A386H3B1_9CLOT|nr:methionine ABC transporter ATP-binding protein [Clostridium fermenticellae]AYD40156.1 methionine ABC transporter ATP-binding protein [Clostridium fermenticellae]